MHLGQKNGYTPMVTCFTYAYVEQHEKILSVEFWYMHVASSRMSLPSLFKLYPWHQNLSHPRDQKFYIDLN